MVLQRRRCPDNPKLPSTPKKTRFHPFFHPDASSALSSSLTLSPSSMRKIQTTLNYGWAPSTLDSYRRTFDKFSSFCNSENIPLKQRFPSDEHLLCAFAASLAGQMAHSTVRNHLSALKAWHYAHGYEWKGGNLLQCIMRGVKRMVPNSSVRPPRSPVTYDMLQVLRRDLDHHNHLHACVYACALVAFWGQCRLGELIPAETTVIIERFPKAKHFDRLALPSKLPSLHLPSTKTHQNSGETVVLTTQSKSLSPAKALLHHIDTNQIQLDFPLFLFKSGSSYRHLTKSIFLRVCNHTWAKHSYPPIHGHSFRIGGTSELLVSGVNPDVVKVLGRWHSDSFIRYWRFSAEIAAANTLKMNK